MSIDLDWHLLDASLAEKLVDALNRTLAGTSRPSFIGPIEITSFDFGSAPPDVELVDLRSIHRDFLDADDDSSDSGGEDDSVSSGLSGEARKHTQRGAGGGGYGEDGEEEYEDEDGFEWVSRRAARRGLVEDGYPYAHLPPHMRYNYGVGGGPDLFASTPSLPLAGWSSGALGMGMGMGMGMNMSVPSLGDFRPSAAPPRPSPASATATAGTAGLFRGASTPSLASPSPSAARGGIHPALGPDLSNPHARPYFNGSTTTPSDPLSQASASASAPPPTLPPDPNPNAPAPHPNLQLHLYLTWHSNLRLTLSTSLLINYPSPAFMALPIKLAVTGLVFRGELAVAYEGARRRVHVCILDDLDPYAPACRRPSAPSASASASAQRGSAGSGAGGGLSGAKGSSTDLSASLASLAGLGRPSTGAADPVDGAGGEVDAATPPEIDETLGVGSGGGGAGSGGGRRDGKPAPVGQRLLPSIFIESEIGQADKHVLKNVTRVERFIQDVIRKTVEEELVFPNFHTLVLGDQSQS